MNKKLKYTTLQVRREVNDSIRQFCITHGYVAASVTERLWMNHISASMSGSVLV